MLQLFFGYFTQLYKYRIRRGSVKKINEFIFHIAHDFSYICRNSHAEAFKRRGGETTYKERRLLDVSFLTL